jgi:hypothetical protein
MDTEFADDAASAMVQPGESEGWTGVGILAEIQHPLPIFGENFATLLLLVSHTV